MVGVVVGLLGLGLSHSSTGRTLKVIPRATTYRDPLNLVSKRPVGFPRELRLGLEKGLVREGKAVPKRSKYQPERGVGART